MEEEEQKGAKEKEVICQNKRLRPSLSSRCSSSKTDWTMGPPFIALVSIALLAAYNTVGADTTEDLLGGVSNICARVHNNTALEGIAPAAVFYGNAFECQKKCVQLFPDCNAVVYYYVRNDTQHHYCYLFSHNSANGNGSLVEQQPPTKKDLVRMLELVEDCHEFDAFPPIEDEEGLASSNNGIENMDAGEWTDWSACGEDSDASTRSRECLYGRRIEKRGCPARQYRPLPPAPPPRPPVLAPLIRTPQLQPQQPQYPQYPQLAPQAPRQLPPVDSRQRVSPSDEYAQQYAERAHNYRPRMRHPAQAQAVPCTGPRCPNPAARREELPRAHPISPATTPAPVPLPLPSRYRPAPPPPPGCNSPGCIPTRPPLGEWYDWSDWSSCSCSCGDGVMQRRRECNGAYCLGDEYEEAKCSLGPCQTWSEWCEWSECRPKDGRNCGRGESVRTRFCLLGTQRCEGIDFESRACDAGACPEWTDWNEWSSCSVTCGNDGRRSRTRTCLGGVRGDECPGPRIEDAACQAIRPCSFWGPWAQWSACSASCGRGNKRRSRVCQHGTDCIGDAEWTEWCEWSLCSAQCGPGLRSRTRACMGSDGRESNVCHGSAEESQVCEGDNCCQWSEWCDWSDCDKRCGGGLSLRSRTCERSGGEQSPFEDTCQCVGPESEQRVCNPQPCQLQCSWTQWCAWSDCSTQLQCQVGVQLRSRQCVGEAGCECVGLADENQQCRGSQPCPTTVPC